MPHNCGSGGGGCQWVVLIGKVERGVEAEGVNPGGSHIATHSPTCEDLEGVPLLY